MTSPTARARAKARSLEERLGGEPGDPVDIRAFRPQETVAKMVEHGLTPALIEQVDVGAEFLPRAREGKNDCVLCRKPFLETPIMVGWLETPRGDNRVLFGVCVDCDGPDPDLKARLFERFGAIGEHAIN